MSFSSAARRGSSDALSAGAAGRGAGVPVSEALSAALARDEVSSEVSSGEFKASVSCKVRLARRAPGACQAANSGACVRFELQLQQDDGVLDFEFALFQALQLEVVDAGLIRYSVDQTVEPTMLRLQLQNPVAKCVRVDDVMLIAHARLRSTVTRAACSRCSARCLRLLSGSKRVTATVCTTARAGYCVHYCDITTAWHPPCGWVRSSTMQAPFNAIRMSHALRTARLATVAAVAVSAALRVASAASTVPGVSARLFRRPASGALRHRPGAARPRPVSFRSSAASRRAPALSARPACEPRPACAGSRPASGRKPADWQPPATG